VNHEAVIAPKKSRYAMVLKLCLTCGHTDQDHQYHFDQTGKFFSGCLLAECKCEMIELKKDGDDHVGTQKPRRTKSAQDGIHPSAQSRRVSSRVPDMRDRGAGSEVSGSHAVHLQSTLE
jgi:hypothetical protein